MSKYFKGCPFCGRYGYNLQVKVFSDGESAWAECWDCHAKGPVIGVPEGEGGASTIDRARAAWNARAIQDRSYAKYLGGREASRDGKKEKSEGHK